MKWIVGISVLALTIVMGWAAIATIPAAAISTDDASFRFLPAETQGIVFIDVAALRNTPLVRDSQQEILNHMPLPRGADEFTRATGFDPQNDLDKVTLAKLGARDGLVIVQGRIDRFKVEQFLRDKGRRSEAYLGQTLHQDGDTAIVILDSLALIGPASAVKKAIDQMQIPGSQPLRSDLLAAIQTIEAGSQVWAVGDVSAKDLRAAGVRGPEPALEMLKTLKGGTYQMRVDTDVHARATGSFEDAQSAQGLTETARGVLALAKLQFAKQQPDMLRVLDGIQVSNSGTTLTVRIEESGETLKKLKNLRPAAVLGQ